MADHQNPLRLFQRNMSTAVADSKLIEKLKNTNNGNEKDHHQHTIFHLAGGFINSFAGAQSKELAPMHSFKTLEDFIQNDEQEKIISFLQSRSCNVNDCDNDSGTTALMVASSLGKFEFVQLLLNHNANVKLHDVDGASALHMAAKNGHSEVCHELLEAEAVIEATDSGGWTPLIWACYKGHVSTVECLISKGGGDVNARGQYNLTGLVWASGRGHYSIVELLLDQKDKIRVDAADKYGTTSLIWATRAGHIDIVKLLLKAGANVDAVGMYSWTPLLVATRANYVDIVELLLSYNPNINTIDKDGMTALAIACKEGYSEIALKLINSGSSTNLQDRSGDTHLIHASKGGHKTIVEALLKKYADVNIRGKEGKTCVHWAIDKNHSSIVRTLINADPDLEIKTSEGETPLLRAVLARNAEIVELLLDKKRKLIHATNNKGDTALHIAMRTRSKAVVEVLLRHPKHGQLLYRPNNKGETPYSLDMTSNKPIVGQIFGKHRLNANEENEGMLGYDLYSSALANILTEPSLSMPITVGLYAKWGSGKNFFMGKLREEMKVFTRDWNVEPTFENTTLVFMVILHVAVVIGMVTWIFSYLFNGTGISSTILSLSIGATIIILSYTLFISLWKFSQNNYVTFHDLKALLATKFNSLKLIVQVMFSHPPGQDWLSGVGTSNQYIIGNVNPLRLLFTDQTKVTTSAGGQNSVTQMIGSLYDAIEEHHGTIASRLFRAFRPKPLTSTSKESWRNICCIPYALIYCLVITMILACIIMAVILSKHEYMDDPDPTSPPEFSLNTTMHPISSGNGIDDYDDDKVRMGKSNEEIYVVLLVVLITIAVIIGLILVANVNTLVRCIKSLIFSQRRHLQSTIAKLDLVKSEGYLQAVKSEVELMVKMIKTLDAFTGTQTRLVVVVDGLDSCEQSKVLSVLDAVHMLFSDEGSPFIILLAIDPHVVSKAVEINIHQAFRDTSIGGMTYLRNIVHLPFYLQNSGLRKVTVAQQAAMESKRSKISSWVEYDRHDTRRTSTRRESEDLITKSGGAGRHRKGSIGSASSIGSKYHGGGGGGGFQNATDVTKIIATDDYTSDVNVKSMRRLMNVVYVMNRLMKAFHIDFNWANLATWVNVTEQWPYRMSWIFFYIETSSEHHHDQIDDSTSLWDIWKKVKPKLPHHRDLEEPLMHMDRDEKKLEAILKIKYKMLTVKQQKIFLPFSINLDPYVKKVIRDEITSLAATEGTDVLEWFIGKDTTKSNRARAVANKTGLMTTLRDPKSAAAAYFQEIAGTRNNELETTMAGNISPPFVLPKEATYSRLSKKSISEVCDLIRHIDGLMTSKLDDYIETINAQNINGAVLSHCNIVELKKVLGMSFGDWEIFQMVLVALRHHEKVQRFHAKLAAMENDEEIDPNISTSAANNGRDNDVPNSLDESAVTMEDALIHGILSTVTEDAQEDILTSENLTKKDRSGSSGSDFKDHYGKDENIIYLARTTEGAMSLSVGSEDALGALERGIATNRSIRSIRSMRGSESSDFMIGGNESGSGSLVDITSMHHLHLDSTQTSPTKTHITAPQLYTTPSKTRHLNDRLDPRKSREYYVDQGDEEEPYAWISQTAPSSPMPGRSRNASITYQAEDYLHEQQQHPGTSNSAISMERIGDRVKKKLRVVKNKIEHPTPGQLPPVQRPKDKATEQQQPPALATNRLKSSTLHGSHENSIASLPIFGDSTADSEDDDEEDEDDEQASPIEQQTVLPRERETPRPNVQNIFQEH